MDKQTIIDTGKELTEVVGNVLGAIANKLAVPLEHVYTLGVQRIYVKALINTVCSAIPLLMFSSFMVYCAWSMHVLYKRLDQHTYGAEDSREARYDIDRIRSGILSEIGAHALLWLLCFVPCCITLHSTASALVDVFTPEGKFIMDIINSIKYG